MKHPSSLSADLRGRGAGKVKRKWDVLTFKIVKMKTCEWKLKKFSRKQSLHLIAIILLTVCRLTAEAQDGNAGINEANSKVRSYFASGTNLMYAVGALVGLIGAVKVYQKWNAGDQDTGKVAAAWFGSCVFLVVVTTVIKSFFGI